MSGEQSLATVIGLNARKARRSAGLTLDQVAIAACGRGLQWSESRVADFEAGRVAPTLTTLVALCLALADLKCADATLPELVTNPRAVEINESLALSSADLRNVLSGRPAEKPKQRKPSQDDIEITDPRVREVVDRSNSSIRAWAASLSVRISSGATEERVRKSLGITSDDLAALSQALWKRSFAQERDRRAGPGANAQKRGQISRVMLSELRKALETRENGHDK
jgi:transcriptional regulator with XRE-family HTH domain